MMSPHTCTALILVLGLAAVAHSSSIKGHQQQDQVVRQSVKSPVQSQQQFSDRSPKSAPVAQPQQVVLESSKKVYNDESIRRSVSQQAAAAPVAVEQQYAAVKSPVQPVAAAAVEPSPVAAVPIEPVKEAAAPVVVAPQQAPVVPAKEAPVVVAPQQAPVKVQPVAEPVVKAPVVEQPAPVAAAPAAPVVKAAAPKAEELPSPSERSAPVKEEAPVAPSVVTVEQVVPAKVPSAPAAPVAVEPVAPQQPQQQPVAPVIPVAAAPAADSPLQAKKEEPVAAAQAAPAVVKESSEPSPIDVPAPDPGLVLSEPIDSTTKLLIDLDEHVQKFLPAEDKQEPAQPAKEQVLVGGVDYSPAGAQASDAVPVGKSNVPLVPYSSNAEEPIVPPLPSLEKVEKASGAQASPASSSGVVASGQSATRQGGSHQHQNQQQVITQLLDQLDSLQSRIQDTINQLVARRRYVMSALLRPMGTYVRRVRNNLERLQNRVNQLQAAAVSVGGNSNGNQNRPGGFVDAAAIETIRRRIDDISKRISDIVNRIRFSLTPTSAPLNNNGRR